MADRKAEIEALEKATALALALFESATKDPAKLRTIIHIPPHPFLGRKDGNAWYDFIDTIMKMAFDITHSLVAKETKFVHKAYQYLFDTLHDAYHALRKNHNQLSEASLAIQTGSEILLEITETNELDDDDVDELKEIGKYWEHHACEAHNMNEILLEAREYVSLVAQARTFATPRDLSSHSRRLFRGTGVLTARQSGPTSRARQNRIHSMLANIPGLRAGLVEHARLMRLVSTTLRRHADVLIDTHLALNSFMRKKELETSIKHKLEAAADAADKLDDGYPPIHVRDIIKCLEAFIVMKNHPSAPPFEPGCCLTTIPTRVSADDLEQLQETKEKDKDLDGREQESEAQESQSEAKVTEQPEPESAAIEDQLQKLDFKATEEQEQEKEA